MDDAIRPLADQDLRHALYEAMTERKLVVYAALLLAMSIARR